MPVRFPFSEMGYIQVFLSVGPFPSGRNKVDFKSKHSEYLNYLLGINSLGKDLDLDAESYFSARLNPRTSKGNRSFFQSLKSPQKPHPFASDVWG